MIDRKLKQIELLADLLTDGIIILGRTKLTATRELISEKVYGRLKKAKE